MFVRPAGVGTGKCGEPIEETPGRCSRVRFGSVRYEFGYHLTIASDVDGPATFGFREYGRGVVAQVAHAEPLGRLVFSDHQIANGDVPTSHNSDCSTDACYINRSPTMSDGDQYGHALVELIALYGNVASADGEHGDWQELVRSIR